MSAARKTAAYFTPLCYVNQRANCLASWRAAWISRVSNASAGLPAAVRVALTWFISAVSSALKHVAVGPGQERCCGSRCCRARRRCRRSDENAASEKERRAHDDLLSTYEATLRACGEPRQSEAHRQRVARAAPGPDDHRHTVADSAQGHIRCAVDLHGGLRLEIGAARGDPR